MNEDAEATSKVSPVYAFLQRRASGNPTLLSEYLKELEEAGTLSRPEIIAAANAVMRAFEHGKIP